MLGKPIDLLVADHQNKVDVGLAIARKWYDEHGARAIFDITNSGVALAIQELAKERNRLVIFDSASSSDLTGKACSPNGIQWNADNWSNGVALMRLLIRQKLDSFFFITADYAFGVSLEADARDAIAKAGGTVVGGGSLAAEHRRFQLLPDRGPGFEGEGHRVRHHRRRSLERAEAGQRVSSSPRRNISRRRSPISATSTRSASTSRTISPSCSPGTGTSTTRRGRLPNASTPAASACRTTTRSRSIRPCAIISRRSRKRGPTRPAR